METSTKSVMIIDDDTVSSYVTKAIVKKSGFFGEIVTLENADKALDFLKERLNQKLPCPDLIIVDINMPGTSGQEFLQELREIDFINAKDVVVAGLSAEKVRINKSLKYAFNETFVKPFKKENCQYLVENYFGEVCAQVNNQEKMI